MSEMLFWCIMDENGCFKSRGFLNAARVAGVA